MKNTIEIIKELKNKTDDWKKLMTEFMDDNLEETEDSYQVVLSIFRRIREIYKDKSSIPEEICKEIDDKELLALIDNYVRDSLEWYFDLSLLRDLQKDNADIASNLLSIIMNEFVIHTGINGKKKLMDLLEPTSKYDDAAIAGLISALGHFTKQSVTNNLTNECMKISVNVDGAISETLSQQIADMIWENRLELKMDYIIYQIGDVESALQSI